ncbi:NAD(+) diphosphatase [Acidiferrimicrobium sp. IK]|uniref:NAD(+) diphosphatase n=1 Tax=Acidiferrimicrobium sp. IK TaxID=2871700 RepID=UPI0021CB5077|nr:NAD(+) diphosphatase [Acidiferrimicrobium sp. IK]MCU4185671.1 NAD(+) diphosphatase [Acidiferrimicrobium sp. IK]
MPTFVPDVAPPPGADGPSRWYVVRHGELLTTPEGGLPDADPASLGLVPDADPVYLGALDGQPCWAAGVERSTEAPGELWWQELRSLGGQWPQEEWTLAGRAVQLVEWVRTHRFCGRCATPTERAEGERALRCPACGLSNYPRLAPAIIVLVRRGEEALLAQGNRFRGRMFSALAGFVEPGETLEEAVHREVFEEVGIKLREPRYVASQPWPFPHSVMIGFSAEWESGELAPDGKEILEAHWWRADDLPPVPPRLSIARRLIDDWVAEVTAGSTPASA